MCQCCAWPTLIQATPARHAQGLLTSGSSRPGTESEGAATGGTAAVLGESEILAGCQSGE